MAGPYNITFKLSNGQTISGYIAVSAAAGTYLPMDTNGKASSTSPEQFQVPANVMVTDIYTNCPTGEVTILSNGQPTNVFINCAVQQETANMRTAPNFGFAAGKQYLVKVTTTCAA